ncbi:hypothetical protein T492DRAFT_316986 [Pavlovales sp. CCMP2436]|nr:hypothetical protein T492DRAFT_316986 [Pavlovales sp. CCMP2436]
MQDVRVHHADSVVPTSVAAGVLRPWLELERELELGASCRCRISWPRWVADLVVVEAHRVNALDRDFDNVTVAQHKRVRNPQVLVACGHERRYVELPRVERAVAALSRRRGRAPVQQPGAIEADRDRERTERGEQAAEHGRAPHRAERVPEWRSSAIGGAPSSAIGGAPGSVGSPERGTFSPNVGSPLVRCFEFADSYLLPPWSSITSTRCRQSKETYATREIIERRPRWESNNSQNASTRPFICARHRVKRMDFGV